MESPLLERKATENTSTTLIQSFSPDNLDLPDDTFRMSLDNFSVIGENVTIRDREMSLDSNTVNCSNAETPVLDVPPLMPTPEMQTPSPEKSPPIVETPKQADEKTLESIRRPQTLLKLSLTKKSENDLFVKPSPISDIMSPAKMLQFEVDFGTSATPTMKRAAIDFDFFTKNNFDEYFDDVRTEKDQKAPEKPTDGNIFKETPVIVKANTVRHEIGYGFIAETSS